jgi:hypothetical protein
LDTVHYDNFAVETRIREFCRLIAAETDHNRLQELARELDFALAECNLQLRNQTLSFAKSAGHSKAPLGNTVEYQ